MTSTSLLMIPGPIEISDAVHRAAGARPVSHLDPVFKEHFGEVLRGLRSVFLAGEGYRSFVVAGGGTFAMESAAVNLVDPGHTVLVVNTGLFGDRMAEMLRRRGANVLQVGAAVGEAVPVDEVAEALREHRPRAVFATHVDTSTGVRLDVEGVARVAREQGVLSVFDGVCAAAAEVFRMEAWGADVYYCASQKAIGMPAGLALWVVSPRAMRAREALGSLPPLVMDWAAWEPIVRAYEEGRNAYFSTPPTTLIPALRVALGELVEEGMERVFERHARVASRMRAAFRAMGLRMLSQAPANTLTAMYWPDGVDGAAALGAIRARGVVVAGGLHPSCAAATFRVGHMGVVTRDERALVRTVRAVGEGLSDVGASVDVEAALRAFEGV